MPRSYKNDVAPEEKARLLDQQIAAKSAERYALEAAELAGDDVDASRKKKLDEGLKKLHDARSNL